MGPTAWQKAIYIEPSSVFKLVGADAIKCTNEDHKHKDHKHKDTAVTKLQHKRHNIASATAVDNRLISSKAYSR